jgi:hypothetical protein
MLGFKSKGLNPEYKKINVKMKNANAHEYESQMSESSNKYFHCVRWEITRGLFMGQLGGWFTMSKQPLTAPQIT